VPRGPAPTSETAMLSRKVGTSHPAEPRASDGYKPFSYGADEGGWFSTRCRPWRRRRTTAIAATAAIPRNSPMTRCFIAPPLRVTGETKILRPQFSKCRECDPDHAPSRCASVGRCRRTTYASRRDFGIPDLDFGSPKMRIRRHKLWPLPCNAGLGCAP